MESSTSNPSGRTSIGRWAVRLLAVLAVAGAAIAVILVISGSDVSTEGEGKQQAKKEAPKNPEGEGGGSEETPKTYVVQPGDTIDAIAARFGVTAEKIQELNPDIDPQALPSGATLELR
jgi:LysM repeat protein